MSALRGRWSHLVLLVLVVVVAGAAIRFRSKFTSWLRPAPGETVTEEPLVEEQEPKVLKLSAQARKNLKLVSKPIKVTSDWRMIEIPGAVVDRPGQTDRGVTSPAVGIVIEIHAFPGDMVKPGDRLFTLRLFSEYLQNTQSELFKATRERELISEQRARLEVLAKSGSLPESRLIELDGQMRRQTTIIQSFTQDLLTRGLTPDQITGVTEGTFVSTIDVLAPPATRPEAAASAIRPVALSVRADGTSELAYEVQELAVELGQQVQAGQLLSTLANHQSLFIEGHAFKSEASALARAVEQNWPLECAFAEDDAAGWSAMTEPLRIRHLANSIDPESRTFDFFVPLTNQSRSYEKDGQTFLIWRYRPGQRVRLQIPIEELRDVIVLPAAAVVREGPEAYVFQQNGDLFNRLPVHVIHEDRERVMLANDGSVRQGTYLAQSAAASLNRVLKAQAASGVQANVHVHADGTVHGAH